MSILHTSLALYPVIIESPKNVLTPLLSTALFTCIGQGYGYVSVTWKKRNTNNPLHKKIKAHTIYTSNHHIISTLTVPSVKNKDAGTYQCVYVNSIGSAYSNFATLKIGGKHVHDIYHMQYVTV